MLRKRLRRLVLAEQHREQPRQMRKVAGDQHIARLAAQAIANPVGRIGGLDVARRGKIRQRIARAPEGFRGLSRPQLAAVPNDGRPRASNLRLFGQSHDMLPSGIGQRTPRIDIRADGVAVVNEDKSQRSTFNSQGSVDL